MSRKEASSLSFSLSLSPSLSRSSPPFPSLSLSHLTVSLNFGPKSDGGMSIAFVSSFCSTSSISTSTRKSNSSKEERLVRSAMPHHQQTEGFFHHQVVIVVMGGCGCVLENCLCRCMFCRYKTRLSLCKCSRDIKTCDRMIKVGNYHTYLVFRIHLRQAPILADEANEGIIKAQCTRLGPPRRRKACGTNTQTHRER